MHKNGYFHLFNKSSQKSGKKHSEVNMKHRTCFLKGLALSIVVFVLAACSSNQVTYKVTGTAKEAEITYTDAGGSSQTQSVGLPWETSYTYGGDGKFSLIVKNTTSQGNIRCAVLLGEREMGHAEAKDYASCEGHFSSSGGRTEIKFESSSDVPPAKLTPAPAATKAVAAPIGPRTNGGGSGLIAFVGRDKSWPAAQNEIFLLQFDGASSKIVPLTDGVGKADRLAWSPDGATLLFTRLQKQGKTYLGGIYALDLRNFQAVQLTDQFGAQYGVGYPPVWSPDGRRILYSSDHTGNDEVYVMNADGSAVTNLTRHQADDMEPCWSPDGRTIYFRSSRNGPTKGEIYAMSADGSNVRQLTKLGGGTPGGLAISPDGQRLAFYSKSNLYAINADGTGQIKLTSDSKSNYNPAWSPDGTRIAFDSQRSGERDKSGKFLNTDIYVVTVPDDAGDPKIVRLTTDSEEDQVPVWTPDGTMIAFESKHDGLTELYLINADGTGLTRLTEHEDWIDFRPVWQPATGKATPATLPASPVRFSATAVPASPTPPAAISVKGRIVFSSDRDGNFEIYTANVDGSDPVRLTDSPAADGEPVWSPDGTRILFTSERDGNAEIYSMQADGSDVTRLTNDPGVDVSPAWSPNGKLIAFATDRAGNFDIYLMRSDGLGVTPFITNTSVDLSPAWSHTTSEIVFVSDREGALDLYIADSKGKARRLAKDLGQVASPSWSPDGRSIAFVANLKSNYDLFVVDPAGLKVQQVSKTEFNDELQPAWSPDSQYILFVSVYQGKSEIYMIDGSARLSRVTNNQFDDNAPDWGPIK